MAGLCTGRKNAPEDGERFSVDWRLAYYAGPVGQLATSIGNNVHVAGLSVREENDPNTRPYTDILFYNGGVEVTLDPEQAPFNLGRVVGLEILSQGKTYTVWPAEQ